MYPHKRRSSGGQSFKLIERYLLRADCNTPVEFQKVAKAYSAHSYSAASLSPTLNRPCAQLKPDTVGHLLCPVRQVDFEALGSQQWRPFPQECMSVRCVKRHLRTNRG